MQNAVKKCALRLRSTNVCMKLIPLLLEQLRELDGRPSPRVDVVAIQQRGILPLPVGVGRHSCCKCHEMHLLLRHVLRVPAHGGEDGARFSLEARHVPMGHGQGALDAPAPRDAGCRMGQRQKHKSCTCDMLQTTDRLTRLSSRLYSRLSSRVVRLMRTPGHRASRSAKRAAR